MESWIKESEQDKSVQFGLDVPVGTWVVMYKVDNDEIWNDEVKAGKVFGLSIEGFFDTVTKLSKEERLLQEVKNLVEKYK